MKINWSHSSLVLTALALGLGACASSDPADHPFRQANDDDDPSGGDAPVLAYRVYRLSETNGVRTVDRSDFDGLLAMPTLGPEQAKLLRKDSLGNLTTGWFSDAGNSRRMLLAPERGSVHSVAHAPDGTVSASLDADGDGVADIVDIVSPDLPRTLIVTEALGLGLLDTMRAGFDPFCFELQAEGLDSAGFGCPEASGGAGDSTGTGPSATPSDIADIFCNGFTAGPQFFDAPVYAHGDPYHRPTYNEPDSADDADGRLVAMRLTTVRYDNDGNHVETVRTTAYTDGHNNIVRIVYECVQPDGSGHRRITDIAPDGSRTVEEEDFETEVYDNNNFPSYDHTPGHDEDDPPPNWDRDPEKSESGWEHSNDVGSADAGGYPPPEPDPDGSIDEFCAEQAGNNPSGVEQVIHSNVTDISFDCEDFVINPGSTLTGDSPLCGTIWTPHADLDTVLETGVVTNDCGPTMMPGPDGTCGGRSVDRIRGGVARVQQANLEGIELCDPLVCNPGNF